MAPGTPPRLHAGCRWADTVVDCAKNATGLEKSALTQERHTRSSRAAGWGRPDRPPPRCGLVRCRPARKPSNSKSKSWPSGSTIAKNALLARPRNPWPPQFSQFPRVRLERRPRRQRCRPRRLWAWSLPNHSGNGLAAGCRPIFCLISWSRPVPIAAGGLEPRPSYCADPRFSCTDVFLLRRNPAKRLTVRMKCRRRMTCQKREGAASCTKNYCSRRNSPFPASRWLSLLSLWCQRRQRRKAHRSSAPRVREFPR